MGKKSRRRGAAPQPEHRARMQERRERQLDVLDDPHDDDEASKEDYEEYSNLQFFAGDRVWFRESAGPYERGIVVRSDERESRTEQATPPRVDIIPIDADPTDDSNIISHDVMPPGTPSFHRTVYHDIFPLVPRFQPNDLVAVCTDEGKWVEAQVQNVAVCWKGAAVHCKGFRESQFKEYFLPSDDESHIVRQVPEEDLRFQIGDRVLFDARRAFYTVDTVGPGWVEGKVAERSTVTIDGFGVYLVDFQSGPRSFAHAGIRHDTNEYIVAVDATPRERFLDAIEQDCSYLYFKEIDESFGLDMTTLSDLILERSLQHACYGSLLWLQERTGINLHDACCANGGKGLNITISESPKAEQYFRRMMEVAFLPQGAENAHPRIQFDPGFNPTSHQPFPNGVFDFFESLIEKEKLNLLGLICCTRTGLFASIIPQWFWREDHISRLKEASSRASNEISNLVELMIHFQWSHLVASHLDDTCYSKSDEDSDPVADLLSGGSPGYPGLSASSSTRLVLRFYKGDRVRLNLDNGSRRTAALFGPTMGGYISGVRILAESDPSELRRMGVVRDIRSDHGEFLQPQREEEWSEEEDQLVAVVDAAVVGSPSFYPRLRYRKERYRIYQQNLKQYCDYLVSMKSTNEDHSEFPFLSDYLRELTSYLSKEKLSNQDPFTEYRLKLLTSNGDRWDERRSILDFYVIEKGLEPPDAVNVIRWRCCHVLIWLVDHGLIDLGSQAVKYPPAAKASRSLAFFDHKTIPQALTLGEFLCFCAIEFDDVRSLEWLCEIKDVEFHNRVCCGWNALHLCAYLGRSEAVLYCFSKPWWSSALVSQPSKRKSFQKYLPIHIAVQKGFTFLAEILLKGRSPTNDQRGNGLMHYAQLADYPFVLSMVSEILKPQTLKNDLDRLFRLHGSDKPPFNPTKKFIKSNKCLDYERWKDCEVDSSLKFDALVGRTYRDAVFSLINLHGNADFTTWLCGFLSHEKGENGEQAWYEFWSENPSYMNMEKVCAEQVRASLTCSADELMMKWIDDAKWVSSLSIVDRHRAGSFLASATKSLAFDSRILSSMKKKVMEEIIFVAALRDLRNHLDSLVCGFFLRGERLDSIYPYIADLRNATAKLHALNPAEPNYNWLFAFDGRLNAATYLHFWASRAFEQMTYSGGYLGNRSVLFLMLAVEGFQELLLWVDLEEGALDQQQRLEVVRICGFMGHTAIVKEYLDFYNSFDIGDARRMQVIYAIYLGAMEGRQTMVVDLVERQQAASLSSFKIFDPFASADSTEASQSDDEVEDYDYEKKRDLSKKKLYRSVLAMAVAACVRNGAAPSITANDTVLLERLIHALAENNVVLLVVIKETLDNHNFWEVMTNLRCLSLVRYAIDELGIEWWRSSSDLLIDITKSALSHLASSVNRQHHQNADMMEETRSFIAQWLGFLAASGVDLLKPFNFREEEFFDEELKQARQTLLQNRSQFASLKQGQSLEVVQEGLKSSPGFLTARDSGGLMLIHLVVAYNRVDLLEWLVIDEKSRLDVVDFRGRSVLQLAKASNAREAELWIQEYFARITIARFCASHWRGQRDNGMFRGWKSASLQIQAWFRAESVRKAHRCQLELRLEASRAWHTVWGLAARQVTSSGGSAGTNALTTCWDAMKRRSCDFLEVTSHDNDLIESRAKAQDQAAESALQVKTTDGLSDIVPTFEHLNVSDDEGSSEDPGNAAMSPKLSSNKVYLTRYVVKWRESADSTLREFFSDRLLRLMTGEGGRKLAKRLIGTKSAIYETYLGKRHGAHRILWTPYEDGSILIWYVVAHDAVNHHIALIDASESRSARQVTDAARLLESDLGYQQGLSAGPAAQLDPRSNRPLRLFEVPVQDLERLTDPGWEPSLYLTEEEHLIIEMDGSVLVLGRSGTGKTLCASKRMERDRLAFASHVDFSQLFVARSKRLCKYVESSLTAHPRADFWTFQELLRQVESNIPVDKGSPIAFYSPSQKMDYARFKRSVCLASDGLDPLVIWSNIRSFLKGSIEALQQSDNRLTKADYLSLGKRRCRLSLDQREQAYAVFLRYEKVMKEQGLWDDMDRAASLVARLENARQTALPAYDSIRRSKLYVDEVQDYTQTELYLFFLLCGPGDLFMVGDPCQSVVEGVDFRFEDIRSVGYYICGERRRDLIPDKPKILTLNFRSHAGILQTAAAVLKCLFAVFPDSAKQLQEDRGLASGPRPGLFVRVSFNQILSKMVSGGVAVLVRDEYLSLYRDALDGYALIYGIREAKGLEFGSVLLLDFFHHLPKALHKPFRDLLKGRIDVEGFRWQNPEVEGHLKLLYTAVTRAKDRLFLGEIQSSIAWTEFSRRLTTASTLIVPSEPDTSESRSSALATRCNIDDMDELQQTPDDWRATGFDNAVAAEVAEDLEAALDLMSKALYCFERSDDSALVRQARIYRSSLDFRRQLQSAPTEADAKVEMEAAHHLSSLLSEGFLEAAMDVGRDALPYFGSYSQEQVEVQILQPLVELLADGSA